MQPFSPTAITILLVVIVGFAAVMIIQMLRQAPRRPQQYRRPAPQPPAPLQQPRPQPPAPPVQPVQQTPPLQQPRPEPSTLPVQQTLAQLYEISSQPPEAPPLAQEPPTVEHLAHAPRPVEYQTAKPGPLLEAPLQPVARARREPPLVRYGKALLTAAGFAAIALVLLVAMPQSWFDGLVRRLPGRHAASVTSGETLWLEALAEEKSPEQLRVTGKIRNVVTRELRNPQAVIKVYGFDNNVMGTIASPLKEYYLASQAESEFAISYQVDSSKVLRYTVAFQEPDGTALPHKDVRTGK